MDSKAKVFAYSLRSDERKFFEDFCQENSIELASTKEAPSLETVQLAKGFPAISIITTAIPRPLLEAYRDIGVGFISTRTIGYDHIDLSAAKDLGIRVGNAPYSPDSVADYSIMLMLMATRNIKAIMRKSQAQDFTLAGVRGIELRNLSVGIAGTGRIGAKLIHKLSGFGCRILAYDRHPKAELEGLARYVSWEQLCAQSDLISLHMPATDDNFHIIDQAALARMKDGVFIINTARGTLIDTTAFLAAIESGKIGGAALDVIEDEKGLFYDDLRGKPISNRDYALLSAFPNVILTPHTAFYTDQAVRDMAENSLRSCLAFQRGTENSWEIF